MSVLNPRHYATAAEARADTETRGVFHAQLYELIDAEPGLTDEQRAELRALFRLDVQYKTAGHRRAYVYYIRPVYVHGIGCKDIVTRADGTMNLERLADDVRKRARYIRARAERHANLAANSAAIVRLLNAHPDLYLLLAPTDDPNTLRVSEPPNTLGLTARIECRADQAADVVRALTTCLRDLKAALS